MAEDQPLAAAPGAGEQRPAAGRPPRALRGLGPRSQALLASVGVTDEAGLRTADPFEVYLQVRRLHPDASLNLLYALIGAVEDRDWRAVAREERTSILRRLEELGGLRR